MIPLGYIITGHVGLKHETISICLFYFTLLKLKHRLFRLEWQLSISLALLSFTMKPPPSSFQLETQLQ